MRYVLLLLLLGPALLPLPATAQGETRLLRDPAVSADLVAFAYAGDLWTVPRTAVAPDIEVEYAPGPVLEGR